MCVRVCMCKRNKCCVKGYEEDRKGYGTQPKAINGISNNNYYVYNINGITSKSIMHFWFKLMYYLIKRKLNVVEYDEEPTVKRRQ